MLDQNSDEALKASERRAVNHHWPMPLIVRTHIFELKSLGQIVIELNSP